MPQFPDQLLLKSRGNGVLQPLCFIVDLIPGHVENLRQHPLDQVVANHGAFGNFAPLRSEPDAPFFCDGHELIFCEALQGKRYRRPGHR